ncbi:MAG: hypothetical protein M3179_02600 [Actinomycetota bacterium]|nr:hypothetical protein [Actinomycetota bacterium]
MRLRREGDHWVLVGGPVPPGSDAITIVRVISVRASAADDEHLMDHERAHVRQWRELGIIGFLRRYLGSYLASRRAGYAHRQAYLRIPLEVEAEAAAEAADEERRGRRRRAAETSGG